MVACARSVAVVGLDAVAVTVEAHAGPGLPGFSVIGLSGGAAGDAADRVRTALTASGISLPARKLLVSLAPADVPKAGARFDLAMAAAVLGELGCLTAEALDAVALVGELALDGSIRPVRGVLPSAAFLASAGVPRLAVAEGNAAEAALVCGLEVVAVADVVELLAVLRGDRRARTPGPARRPEAAVGELDLADVRGQAEARRALEVAAAGGHHLLLLGPPGCGKSMLARRLPGLLPPLDPAAALELAAVRSVAGLLDPLDPLPATPPLRAPHHTISAAALFGGGTGIARPGELSLAQASVKLL